MYKILSVLWLATVCLVMAGLASLSYADETPPLEKGGLYPVTLKEVEGAISKALIEKGAGQQVSAVIIGKRTTVMYNVVKPVELQVKTLDFDSTSGKWSANLLFVAGSEVLSAVPLAGRYEEMASIPVLKKQFHEGEVIHKDDVTYQSCSKARVRDDTVTDAAQLIGKTPRRAISAGRPIRTAEMQAPSVLKKGAVVEMQYQTPYMKIRTLGEAMNDGAVGDVIAIRNQTSRKIVQATIVSASEVRVDAMGEEKQAAVTPQAQEALPEEDPYNEKL